MKQPNSKRLKYLYNLCTDSVYWTNGRRVYLCDPEDMGDPKRTARSCRSVSMLKEELFGEENFDIDTGGDDPCIRFVPIVGCATVTR